jgi:intracellular sulfur oxidation DsrE/DsrF family protein
MTGYVVFYYQPGRQLDRFRKHTMPKKNQRRSFLTWLAAAPAALVAKPAGSEERDDDLFGEPEHKLVYQFNKIDPEYMEHVLFSVGVMLREHTDNIHIVVSVFGPGIHILAKRPHRPVPELIRQRVRSLSAYGVSFHACKNTLDGLKWADSDLLDFAEIVESGADDLMQLQERGYSYISW